MANWSKRWKWYKIMLLILGVAACVAIAVSAQEARASGGLLKIVQGVLFRGYLFDDEGWFVDLHPGGWESFAVTGYFVITDYFLCSLALVFMALVFLFLKPGKAILVLYALIQLAAVAFLTFCALFAPNALPFVVAVVGWGMQVYHVVLMRQYWRLVRGSPAATASS